MKCNFVNCGILPKKFSTKMAVVIHFIYYINRLIATKVDSTYLGYYPKANNASCLWIGDRWAETSVTEITSLTLTDIVIQVEKN